MSRRKGHDVILSEKGRYIVWKGSPAQKEIRTAIDNILRKYDYARTTEFHKERGVYVFYLKVNADPVQGPKPKEVCPLVRSTTGGKEDAWSQVASKGAIREQQRSAKNGRQDRSP